MSLSTGFRMSINEPRHVASIARAEPKYWLRLKGISFSEVLLDSSHHMPLRAT